MKTSYWVLGILVSGFWMPDTGRSSLSADVILKKSSRIGSHSLNFYTEQRMKILAG
jgi:hypothetical protein